MENTTVTRVEWNAPGQCKSNHFRKEWRFGKYWLEVTIENVDAFIAWLQKHVPGLTLSYKPEAAEGPGEYAFSVKS